MYAAACYAARNTYYTELCCRIGVDDKWFRIDFTRIECVVSCRLCGSVLYETKIPPHTNHPPSQQHRNCADACWTRRALLLTPDNYFNLTASKTSTMTTLPLRLHRRCCADARDKMQRAKSDGRHTLERHISQAHHTAIRRCDCSSILIGRRRRCCRQTEWYPICTWGKCERSTSSDQHTAMLVRSYLAECGRRSLRGNMWGDSILFRMCNALSLSFSFSTSPTASTDSLCTLLHPRAHALLSQSGNSTPWLLARSGLRSLHEHFNACERTFIWWYFHLLRKNVVVCRRRHGAQSLRMVESRLLRWARFDRDGRYFLCRRGGFPTTWVCLLWWCDGGRVVRNWDSILFSASACVDECVY